MAEIDGLRERVLAGLRSDDPTMLRAMNAGALEEVLWTEDEWQDEYSDELQVVLDALVAEGTVERDDSYETMPLYWLSGGASGG